MVSLGHQYNLPLAEQVVRIIDLYLTHSQVLPILRVEGIIQMARPSEVSLRILPTKPNHDKSNKVMSAALGGLLKQEKLDYGHTTVNMPALD